jgi:hypothetical protein
MSEALVDRPPNGREGIGIPSIRLAGSQVATADNAQGCRPSRERTRFGNDGSVGTQDDRLWRPGRTESAAFGEYSCTEPRAYYKGNTVMIRGEAFEPHLLPSSIDPDLLAHALAGVFAAYRHPSLRSLFGCEGSPGARAVAVRAYQGAAGSPAARWPAAFTVRAKVSCRETSSGPIVACCRRARRGRGVVLPVPGVVTPSRT